MWSYSSRTECHQAAREAGFSLVELLIAVVVIGILAAVAIPSYQESVIKGRRASVQAYLMDVAQKEQQFFADSRTFTNDLDAVGAPVPDEVASFYTVEVTLIQGPPPSFLITATPISSGPQAKDGPVSIDRAGQTLPAGKW